MMGQGQANSRAGALADELRRRIQNFKPNTSAEQALYAQGLERIHDLGKDREVRLLTVREGLPPMLWLALVSLGIDTVVFAYLVGTTWLHAWAVAALAAGIGLILFTIGVLEHPFNEDLRVSPDAFELVLHTIEGTGEQQS